MSDLNDGNVAEQPSTVLDPRNHNDERSPVHALDAPEEKAGSTRDAIAKAFDEVEKAEKGNEVKDDPAKPEKVAKEAPAEADKAAKDKAPAEKSDTEQPDAKGEKSAAPAKDDAETGQEGDKKARPSEGKVFHEPPARFLPKEKEAWANVPNVVKGAVDRLAKEHEAEVSQYRESHENWQKVAKFDQMAKQHNTSVPEALERYTAVDALLHNQPIEGIRQVLATINLTPEQYARHVMENPDAHRAPPPPKAPDPVVRQTQSEVESLKAELQNMRLEQAAKDIIEPFRRANPRYDELQDDIALFLQSGKIPQNLSPQERLEAAYDMAERINPRSMAKADDPAPRAPEREEAPAVDPRGEKSIRGAPSTGFDPSNTGRAKSRRSAVSSAMAELGI